MPKISIIVPVYNVSKYLRQCLDSIVNQSLKDIEIICLDDGSTDDSLEILKEYAKNDERFVIFSNKNQGTGVIKNKGLELARGECVLFVDSDDWFEEDVFEDLYKKFKENSVDIIQCNYYRYNEKTSTKTLKSTSEIYKKFLDVDLKDNQIYNIKDFENINFSNLLFAAWQRLYSTKFLKENNIRFSPFKYGEDNAFTIRSLLLADKILYTDKAIYNYRVRKGSAVNSLSKENFCIFSIVEEVKDFLISSNLFEKYQKEYVEYVIYILNWQFSRIPFEDRKEYIKKAQNILPKEDFKIFKKQITPKFLKRIFSIGNAFLEGKKLKYITILGKTFTVSLKK